MKTNDHSIILFREVCPGSMDTPYPHLRNYFTAVPLSELIKLEFVSCDGEKERSEVSDH